MTESNFPLVVHYTDTDESVLVLSPDQIDNGRQFKVLATKVKGEHLGPTSTELDDLPKKALPYAIAVDCWQWVRSGWLDRSLCDVPDPIFDLLTGKTEYADGWIKEYRSKEEAEADLINAINLYRSQL